MDENKLGQLGKEQLGKVQSVRAGVLLPTLAMGLCTFTCVMTGGLFFFWTNRYGKERERLKRQASQDALTGVGNRMALEAYLTKIRRMPGHVYHGVMLDIDCFKELNDHNSHSFGDQSLKFLGSALRSLPPQAAAFRFGGDEFCVVFTDCGEDTVKREITRIQERFTDSVRRVRADVCATVSAGIARADHCQTVSQMMENADRMLYLAKKKQGNSLVIHPSSGCPDPYGACDR